MPKTRLCKDSTNQPNNDDIFSDFEPPNSTDGSYKGTMKQVKATEAHLQRKFEEKLEEVKTRLKASNCKVGLKVSGSSIQLQATLPPKPDSGKVKAYQQLISLGIPANLDGLRTAEEEAYELGKLLARKQFTWNEKYLPTNVVEIKIPTLGELLEGFESKYFETRKRTIKSENTFITMYRCMKGFLKPFMDKPYIDISQIYNQFETTVNKDTFARNMNVMLGCYGFSDRLKRLSRKDIIPKERKIPSDKEIINYRENFLSYVNKRKRIGNRPTKNNWLLWQWCYGMLATYGLRPRELFVKPDIDWWLSPENVDNTWKVSEETKTGYREVFPLKAEWIKLFELKNIIAIEFLKKESSVETVAKRTHLVHSVGEWFNKTDIPFQPYDLRHAWAIRAHLMGIPIKAAADNLGHTVEIHTETYQKWFGRDNRKRAINEAINRKSESELFQEQMQQIKLENEQLKLELEQSKLEVERLKLELQYAKLNN
jgi:integrase